MDKKMLYYDCISEFNRQFYRDLLTKESLVSGQIKIDKVSLPDGTVDDEYNFWGYQLEKDGVKYLLSTLDEDENEIDIKNILPIRARKTLKVASKGIVYYHIKEPVSMKFKPEKTMTFKEFVNLVSSLEHSNPTHQKLLWFMAFTQMFDRANFRVTTPAGFGKDSTIDILGNLVGNCATIENPTLAKLEFMTNFKWLGVNEIIDLGKAEWRTIEQFLLASGAHKPAITKHSRAIAGGVNETLDISHFSLSLFYNDIDHYLDDKKYFDSITKSAVKDRFPAIRLYGTYTEAFNNIKGINIRSFVKEKYNDYIELIHNYEYYKRNHLELLNGYEYDKLINVPSRWQTNLGRLLKIIDIYCDNQEEFDEWIRVINRTILDYRAMLLFPTVLKKLYKKLGIPSSIYDEFSNIHDILSYIKDKDKIEAVKRIINANTFLEKNRLIEEYSRQEMSYIDKKFWW